MHSNRFTHTAAAPSPRKRARWRCHAPDRHLAVPQMIAVQTVCCSRWLHGLVQHLFLVELQRGLDIYDCESVPAILTRSCFRLPSSPRPVTPPSMSAGCLVAVHCQVKLHQRRSKHHPGRCHHAGWHLLEGNRFRVNRWGHRSKISSSG